MNEKEILIPFQNSITKADRINAMCQIPKILWFTGLSGAGKSTIADATEAELMRLGFTTYLLDGDKIRMGLNKDLGFSAEGRSENIRRIGEVSKLFLDAGLIVLTTFISPFKKDRDLIRSMVEDNEFIEIFVDCPLEVCEERDVKGLYKKARAGEIKNFTGIDSPYEKPENPEIIIESDKTSVEVAVQTITEKYLFQLAESDL